MYCGIALPGFFGYIKMGYDARARVALKQLIETQTLYHQSSGIYSPDMIQLERFGLQIEPDVVLTVKTADKNCWNATAKHKKNTRVFEADCSGNIFHLK